MEKLSLAELAVAFAIAFLPKFTVSLMYFLHDRTVAKKLADDAVSADHR